nr:DUF2184 domain-containing protein [uncultured Neisseria sp.]
MNQKHMHYDEAEKSTIAAFVQNMGQKFNEDQSVFVARELDYVKAKVYEKKRPPMLGLSLIPQESDAPEWAETITYKVYDVVGMAKIIANYADDLPRADVEGKEHTIRVKTIGNSYGYNVMELKASAGLGQNLPTKKAEAARRAVEVKLNQVAMVGDADYNLYGMTNHPNIGQTTLPVAKSWDKCTGEELMQNLDALWNAVRLQSKGVHTPNKLILSSTLHAIVTSKIYTAGTGETVWGFFLKKHPGLQLVEAPEFDKAGTGGAHLVFIGEFDAENMSHEVVMQFNQLEAQARNLELVVPCYARTAGVSVHYALAFSKAEVPAA